MRAREIIREIDVLLTNLIDLLKPYMDPIDQWELERDAFEFIEKLSAWIEAVEREAEKKNENRGKQVMSKPCRERIITYCFQNACQEIILKYYGDDLCEEETNV
jgi:hypothetical protein